MADRELIVYLASRIGLDCAPFLFIYEQIRNHCTAFVGLTWPCLIDPALFF